MSHNLTLLLVRLSRLGMAAVCMFAFCLAAATPVFAQEEVLKSPYQVCVEILPRSDCDSVSNDTVWHKVEPVNFCAGGAGGAGGAPVVISGDTARDIFNFFVNTVGLQPFQAAGIMGNMQAESSLRTNVEEGKPGEPSPFNLPHETTAPRNAWGFGLIQWTFTARQQPLVDQARAAGVPPTDLGAQLKYIVWELENKYQGTYAKLRAAPDIETATRVIEDEYEVHAGGPQPLRIQNAITFLNQLGSGASPGTTTSNTTTCSGSVGGQLTGGMSLPLDRSFYDQHKDWFTKPHHDYPAADIPVPTGTEVKAMLAGTVQVAPTGGSCGRGVNILSDNGVRIVYCHGDDGGNIPGAQTGDKVQAGQTIMHSDNSGSSTGPHLHVQIEVGGQTRCPQPLFVGIVEGTVPDLASLPTGGCTN